MIRYFKIIDNQSNSIIFFEEDFTIGKIYKESIESDGSEDPSLVGDLGRCFWVSSENLEEVTEDQYLEQKNQ